MPYCGTPDEPKPCPPMPRHPLPYFRLTGFVRPVAWRSRQEYDALRYSPRSALSSGSFETSLSFGWGVKQSVGRVREPRVFSHALEWSNITGEKTDMTLTRRNAMRATAATASAIMLGAKEAFAVSDAAQIQRDSAEALRRLYAVDRRAAALGQKAVGILVFPKIVKGGFIFGAEGGKGVLTLHGHVQGYYTIGAASFGLQAGVQWFGYALFFMNGQALKYLDKSDGWAVGSDPSVVVIDKGAGASIDSTTLSHQVVAMPFGQNGLMAGLALQGSKITTYNPNA
jgi:lipid-binding SYLF domain-containing protein